MIVQIWQKYLIMKKKRSLMINESKYTPPTDPNLKR